MPTVTLYPVYDFYVDQAQPDTAIEYSGINYKLIVGNDLNIFEPGASGGFCYSWIRYDLSSIPSTHTIISAFLDGNMYFGDSGGTSAGTNIDLDRHSNITFDNNHTWNSPPDATGSFLGIDASFYFGGNQPQDLTADMTAAVAAQLSTGGIAWRLEDNGGDGNGLYFQNYTYTPTPPQPFILTVTHSAPGGVKTLLPCLGA